MTKGKRQGSPLQGQEDHYEVDKLIAEEVTGIEPEFFYEVTSPDRKHIAYMADTREQAERWLKSQLEGCVDPQTGKRVQTYLEFFKVVEAKYWPPYSSDKGAAVDMLDELLERGFQYSHKAHSASRHVVQIVPPPADKMLPIEGTAKTFPEAAVLAVCEKRDEKWQIRPAIKRLVENCVNFSRIQEKSEKGS